MFRRCLGCTKNDALIYSKLTRRLSEEDSRVVNKNADIDQSSLVSINRKDLLTGCYPSVLLTSPLKLAAMKHPLEVSLAELAQQDGVLSSSRQGLVFVSSVGAELRTKAPCQLEVGRAALSPQGVVMRFL